MANDLAWTLKARLQELSAKCRVPGALIAKGIGDVSAPLALPESEGRGGGGVADLAERLGALCVFVVKFPLTAYPLAPSLRMALHHRRGRVPS